MGVDQPPQKPLIEKINEHEWSDGEFHIKRRWLRDDYRITQLSTGTTHVLDSLGECYLAVMKFRRKQRKEYWGF